MSSITSRTLIAFGSGLAVALAAVVSLQAWRADAAGGTDSTFVPMTPCRLVDTRPAPHRVGPDGAMTADERRTVAAVGSHGNCTIPNDAVGLTLNATAVGATAATFVTIWPSGTRPTSSSLNPFPGEPPTPNAVTTELSGTGTFEIYNIAGSLDVIIDVNGYYTDASLQQMASDIAKLQAVNSSLESRVAALETLTAPMTIETVDLLPTVRFTGVNVQVVSGSGSTFGAVNGTGNLVVGYHENCSNNRTGSHNLLVGTCHSYSSYGGFIAGTDNTVSGSYGSVTGGFLNTASGTAASVSGGTENEAFGIYGSVSGGQRNTAGDSDSAIGGDDNPCNVAFNAASCDDNGPVSDP